MRETWCEFMTRALYDPQRGYYTARVKTVGARGDFSTSATMSGHLARAIARWIIQQRRETGVCHVIEIGGGDGSLMAGVQRALGFWQRLKLRSYMVERSSILQSQQQSRLKGHVRAWFPTLEEALDHCGGRALIFHNELMDAFPVTVADWRPEVKRWQEVCLDWSDGQVRECHGELALDAASYAVLRTQPDNLQRVELGSDLHGWFKGWLPHWKSGAMLGIDYGDSLPKLYHRRPRGTLRGYLLQQRLEGHELYQNIGRQDLTADVNFTDVRAWLSENKCIELAFETQGQFMQRCGITKAPTLEAAQDAFRCLSVRMERGG
jgi:SAM-dependent MidA family methyltransferase